MRNTINTRRTLRYLSAVPALLCSFAAFALGLGDIELRSKLNEPLNAAIPVKASNAREAEGMTVKLAAPEIYARAGVERSAVLTQLKFAVEQGSDGPYIKVTTEQPVREPFLNFLLDVSWSDGQLTREYTVLLDLPLTVPAEAPEVEAPRATEPASTSPAPAPSAEHASPTPAPTPGGEAATSTTPTDNYGPTRRGDTLWKIAAALRASSAVSMQQMLIALQRANPEAFFGSNINNLKTGQVLRAPSAEELAAVNREEALLEARAQEESWRNARPARVVAAAPEGAAPEVPPETGEQPNPDPPQTPTAAVPEAPDAPARLKLLSPDDATASSSATVKPSSTTSPETQAVAGGGVSPQGTTGQPGTAAEEAERTRVQQLEQGKQTGNGLASAENPQLAALQARMAASEQGAPANAEEITPEAAAPAEPAIPPAQILAQAEVNSPSATELDLPVPPPPPQSIWVSPGMMGGVGAMVLALSATLWWLMRRRRVAATARDFQASFPGAPEGAKSAVLAEEEDFTLSEPLIAQAAADPVEEADIFLSYGRYEQAESLLKEALRKDSRSELRVKLMEVYLASGKRQAFEDEALAYYGKLRNPEADPLWTRVLEMGRSVAPGNPLFSSDAPETRVAPSGFAGRVTDEGTKDEDSTLTARYQTLLNEAEPAFKPGNTPTATASLDETAIKLDLAKAYIDMGDPDGARDLLNEIIAQGQPEHAQKAQELLKHIS